MNIGAAREAYYDYSRTLSSVNRQLALSGIAIIWFFVHPTIQESHSLSLGSLKWSFFFFCLAISFDLLHYTFATIIWGCYSRYKEKENLSEFKAPHQINWIPNIMCFFKVVFTAYGYFLLLKNIIIL